MTHNTADQIKDEIDRWAEKNQIPRQVIGDLLNSLEEVRGNKEWDESIRRIRSSYFCLIRSNAPLPTEVDRFFSALGSHPL